jgi:hypothetical protein
VINISPLAHKSQSHGRETGFLVIAVFLIWGSISAATIHAVAIFAFGLAAIG